MASSRPDLYVALLLLPGVAACAAVPPLRTATTRPALSGWVWVSPKDLEISALLPSPVTEETAGPLRRYSGEQGPVTYSLVIVPLERSSKEEEKEANRRQALNSVVRYVKEPRSVLAIPWSEKGYGGLMFSALSQGEESYFRVLFTGSHMIALFASKTKRKGEIFRKTLSDENPIFFGSLSWDKTFEKKYPARFFHFTVQSMGDGWQTVRVPSERIEIQLPAAKPGQILSRVTYNRHGKEVHWLTHRAGSSPGGANCEVVYLKGSDTPQSEMEEILNAEVAGAELTPRQAREINGMKALEVRSQKGDKIEVFRVLQGPSHLARIRASEGPQTPPGPAAQRCLDAVRFEVNLPPSPPQNPPRSPQGERP